MQAAAASGAAGAKWVVAAVEVLWGPEQVEASACAGGSRSSGRREHGMARERAAVRAREGHEA